MNRKRLSLVALNTGFMMGLKPVEHMSLKFFLEQLVIREGAQVLR